MWQRKQRGLVLLDSVPGKQVDTPGQSGPGMQLALQANDMWFVDASGGEPLTFREVFLKSHALENIVAGKGPSPSLALTNEEMGLAISAQALSMYHSACHIGPHVLDSLNPRERSAGFARWPMSNPREGEVLLELFAVTLGGSKELHASLVECVLSLTAAAAKWRDAGATAEECLSLVQPLGNALGMMKQTVIARL